MQVFSSVLPTMNRCRRQEHQEAGIHALGCIDTSCMQITPCLDGMQPFYEVLPVEASAAGWQTTGRRDVCHLGTLGHQVGLQAGLVKSSYKVTNLRTLYQRVAGAVGDSPDQFICAPSCSPCWYPSCITSRAMTREKERGGCQLHEADLPQGQMNAGDLTSW